MLKRETILGQDFATTRSLVIFLTHTPYFLKTVKLQRKNLLIIVASVMLTPRVSYLVGHGGVSKYILVFLLNSHISTTSNNGLFSACNRSIHYKGSGPLPLEGLREATLCVGNIHTDRKLRAQNVVWKRLIFWLGEGWLSRKLVIVVAKALCINVWGYPTVNACFYTSKGSCLVCLLQIK